MTVDTSGKIAAPTPPPALDQILSTVSDNNGRLQGILADVQSFTARTLGEETPASSASETVQPPGMLGNIHDALRMQSVLISELQEAVHVLEKIG